MFSWSGGKGSVLGGSSLYGPRGLDFFTQLKVSRGENGFEIGSKRGPVSSANHSIDSCASLDYDCVLACRGRPGHARDDGHADSPLKKNQNSCTLYISSLFLQGHLSIYSAMFKVICQTLRCASLTHSRAPESKGGRFATQRESQDSLPPNVVRVSCTFPWRLLVRRHLICRPCSRPATAARTLCLVVDCHLLSDRAPSLDLTGNSALDHLAEQVVRLLFRDLAPF